MGNQTEMKKENPMSQVDGMSSTTYLRVSFATTSQGYNGSCPPSMLCRLYKSTAVDGIENG